MSLDYLLLLLLTLFVAASVLWYFRMRRRMIVFMKKVTVDLEKAFKPVDKTYTLLGYLVGYSAKYVLESGDKVYILFTTVPKHSLIYYLIARQLGRTDQLELAYENTRRFVAREFHFVLESDKRSQQIISRDLGEELNRLSKTEVNVHGRKYVVYYEDSKDVDRVVKLIASSGLLVRRVSSYTRRNLVNVVADIGDEEVQEVVRLLRELNKVLTREKSSS